MSEHGKVLTTSNRVDDRLFTVSCKTLPSAGFPIPLFTAIDRDMSRVKTKFSKLGGGYSTNLPCSIAVRERVLGKAQNQP